MRIAILCVIAIILGTAAWTITRPPDILFEKHEIDGGASESCAFADVNGDGKLDIISGEYWYEGPSWKKHHFRTLHYENFYVDSFSVLPLDVNGDGKIDIVDGGWFGKKLWWNENPGRADVEWKEHVIEEGRHVEFAFLVDLENSGKKRDVLPEFGDKNDPLTWYEPRNGGFVKHVVSPNSYGHGIGAGDVNGDGRTDIVTPKGWFEAPADPRSGEWKFHPDFDLGGTGFIYVLDVNGDGRNDLITTAAHDYGFFWMEHNADGSWTKHMIDDGWAGGHAMTMVDLRGDGRADFITGKRFMAHNGHDPGEREPLGIYWYEFVRTGEGKVEWVKHIIDYGGKTGAGMQIAVADVNGDGALDFAVGGKSGLFLFENVTGRKTR
jgi:hypothetical protein